jgi:hypothetical protein
MVFVLSCSGGGNGNGGEIDPNDGLDRELDNLGLENSIVIQFNNGTPTISNPYKNEVTVSLSEDNVVVKISANTEYNLVVSGATSNGSLKIYGVHNIGLYLNGVNITNPVGPAINIQSGMEITVHLVGGTKNELADGAIYAPTGTEDAKGTFFSEKRLRFVGTGSLEIRSRYNHAIVVDNHFTMESGNITIHESANDGIHANDEIRITGGTLNITSTGDAIQSESLPIRISGGKITAETKGIKSHGIYSGDSTIISENASIEIIARGNGAKGIKSRGLVSIRGGTTSIKTFGGIHTDNNSSDNSLDSNSATGIKGHHDMEIIGGTLRIESIGHRVKGMSIEGDLNISNGNLDIRANDDGMKIHGALSISGGNISIRSERRDGIDCDEDKISITGGNITIIDRNPR